MRCSVALVLGLVFPAALVQGQGSSSYPHTQDAEKHGLWRAGRRMTTTCHYSCTLPISQPMDLFGLRLQVPEMFQRYTVWGLDHVYTANFANGSVDVGFSSKRTMYPPRIVMNFHISYFMVVESPNITCIWSDTIPIPSSEWDQEGTTVPFPMFKLPPRNPREIRHTREVRQTRKSLQTRNVRQTRKIRKSRALPPRLPPGFEPPLGECELLRIMSLSTSDFERTTGTTSTAGTTGVPSFIFPNVFPTMGSSSFQNYDTALGLSMMFYEVQQSGYEQIQFIGSPTSWTNPSGLNHIAPDGTNLIGGWYTGNDLVKSNLPMASAVTNLAWGLHVWKDSYSNLQGQIVETLAWPLIYFGKCWRPDLEKLYVQVGDFYEDRSLWERADNVIFDNLVTQNRWPFYAATPEKPASDVAAEMASAMISSFIAMGDMMIPSITEEYMSQLFDTAVELYNFAVKYQGAYSDHIPETSSEYPSYASSGYKDELCLASMWMYIATYNQTYLDAARGFFQGAGTSYDFSWDNKYPACAILLAKETMEYNYMVYVTSFVDNWRLGNFTDGNLAYHSDKGPLRYSANAAFITLLAEEYGLLTEDNDVRGLKFAVEQINYMLGKNPQQFSYQIGFGENYPLNPYHKNSACPDPASSCGWAFYNFLSTPNVNRLTGALVGGPDFNDEFLDSRAEKIRNSVAIDYNAGFQSALAGLISLERRLKEECQIEPPPGGTTGWTWTPYTDTPSTVWSSYEPTEPTEPTNEPTTTTTSTTSTTQTTKYTTTTSMGIPVKPTTFDFGKALGYSILFYMAQKHASSFPADYPVRWRGNETYMMYYLNEGGWYDDGSEIRTTIAMASSATLLGWGGLQFKDGYKLAGELEHLYDIMKVPLMYFHDMWNQRSFLSAKATRDEVRHRAFWSRPEDYVNEVDYGNIPLMIDAVRSGGADIMAEVVTALAIGSKLFEEKNVSLSEEFLSTAESIYANISQHPGVFEDETSSYYYGNRDDSDEICLSSAWLYKITNNEKYRQDAIKYTQVNYEKELSWHNKHVLCEMLMYEIQGYNTYRRAVKEFVDHWVDGGVKTTQQGLAFHSEQGPLRHAANAAFVALLAADMGIEPEKYQTWAQSQIEYMLGKNNLAYSYQIGYGNRFPRRPHHRGSSCPDYINPCDWSIYNAPGPNPHVLVGALVGGPNANDYFEDARTNYTMNRVAVDYNAGFQSTLAGLIKINKATETTEPPKPATAKPVTTVKTPATAKKTKPPTTTTTKPVTAEPENKTPPAPVDPNGFTTPKVTVTGTNKGANVVSSGSLFICMLLLMVFVARN